ncbi:MAG: lysoplasmalogenase, partial [Candidatus Binatia bacterium]
MIFVVWMVVAVAALLVAERSGSQAGIWAAKPLAAAAFVAAALAWGALDSPYGRVVLVGLFFCWWGD